MLQGPLPDGWEKRVEPNGRVYFVKGVNTKTLSFWPAVMMVTKFVDDFPKKKWFWSKNSILARKSAFFLRRTHVTHLFRVQTDPTQWDHNFLISWGNYGQLQFSGRRLFGRSAGRVLVSGPYFAVHDVFMKCPTLNRSDYHLSYPAYCSFMSGCK